MTDLSGPALPDSLKNKVLAAVAFDHRVGGYVHAVKFGLYHAMTTEMAQMMRHALVQSSWEYDFLVPVPLSGKRMKWRGFNQAEKLALQIDRPKTHNVLRRVRHTGAQARLDARQRAQNLKDAFVATCDLSGRRVIIVDDVYTTGATITACKEALLQAGCGDVRSLVWAYTAK